MAFRDRQLRMSIARAAHAGAPFETIAFDLFPGTRAEDPFLFYRDGSVLRAIRRERPQLLFDEKGKAVALFNGVLAQGKNTWNFVQPIDHY